MIMRVENNKDKFPFEFCCVPFAVPRIREVLSPENKKTRTGFRQFGL